MAAKTITTLFELNSAIQNENTKAKWFGQAQVLANRFSMCFFSVRFLCTSNLSMFQSIRR